MVSRILDRHQDVVAERLASGGEAFTASVIQWLESQQEREAMRRRASVCTFAAWLLMAVASLISCFVAIQMSRHAKAIFLDGMELQISKSPVLILVPAALVATAGVIVVGGLLAWWLGHFPGWSKTVSAIDWSAGSDAVARLLAAGCTYPEAFRLAAQVTKSPTSQNWLREAAARVEGGGSHVAASPYAGADTAMLEALVATSGQYPQRQWQIASAHFFGVATRRLVLLLQSMPMIATIVSGLLVWMAVSSTLGWMWRAVAEMIRGLT